MLTPADKNYKKAKQIMLGQETIRPEFKPLAEWIDKTYDVHTINIVYELNDEDREKDPKPRLEVYLKYTKDHHKFLGPSQFMPDLVKLRTIGEKFKEILAEQTLSQVSVLSEPYNIPESEKYIKEYVWVISRDFETVAKDDANRSIPASKIKALRDELISEEIWKISRFFSGATIFLYTEKQVEKYKDTDVHRKWKDRYFELLEEQDPFGYFKKETFELKLDSKENFDSVDDGNWYSYYK